MKITIVYIISVIITIAIVVGIAYAISVSNLPEWFKFWLLK